MTDCARPTSRPGAFSPDGILNINKPRGMTSFDVVARVRRLTGVSRAGHAGTLDPDATGVLLVCLGKATRLAGFLSGETKTYRATVHLGVATDTYDASGRVTASCDASSVSLASVREVLTRFRGRIMQAPPAYSALKVGGRRLYQLARSGVHVTPTPRPVDVFRLELTRWAPPELDLEIDCGKGTYIRSLAHDLGSALGCGAHLCALERTRSGPFSLADSVTLGELEEACRGGY
ncbi:MAG: tRNA pseudouridine(55) synthase TruB, partial [Chloroflexi bacterium]|nr:tRNA pseudouridine(55) synthase TruB [Chloroflexota bacterium]